jgi:hypothetical protein
MPDLMPQCIEIQVLNDGLFMISMLLTVLLAQAGDCTHPIQSARFLPFHFRFDLRVTRRDLAGTSATTHRI